MEERYQELKALGVSATNNKDLYRFDKPDLKILEYFPWNEPGDCSTVVEIDIPEFTSLCPKTGQPDFAHIKVQYSPNSRCVESKALKLYIMGYRNHGAFHESCVQQICQDLSEVLKPRWLEVQGHFLPRGGISIDPVARYDGNNV